MNATAVAPNADALKCRFDLTGMDCGDCAKTIELSVRTMDGVDSAAVNFGLSRLDVSFDPTRTDEITIIKRVKALGYGATSDRPDSESPWVFDLSGMDCGDCAKTVESGVRRLSGVGNATVNFAAGTLTVSPADGRLTRGSVIAAVSEAGYTAELRGASREQTNTPWWRLRRVIETGAASFLWLFGFGLEHADQPRWTSAIPFLAAMGIAGYPVGRAAWFAAKARRPDMNLLMAIAAVGAIAIGEWDEGSSVLILFAIGLTLQTMTLDRTRRAIQALLKLAPSEATVLRDGQQIRVRINEVAIGDAVIVLPGDRIPVDGHVEEGSSMVDQAPITGESVPVAVEPGSAVFAASINGDGALTVRSMKAANDTTLAKVIHLVEEAQASRAPAQAFVDRFASIYTPIVIAAALVVGLGVPLFAGEWRDWIFRALVLLVVACPCALVISTPVAMVAAVGSASRRGVLFKGGASIEALAKIRSVAFDKTGTLTLGRPAVVKILPFGAWTADELLTNAASVESNSTHPIARGIVEEATRRGLPISPSTTSVALPGKGAKAEVAGRTIFVGSARLFDGLFERYRDDLKSLDGAGNTLVLVGSADDLFGAIALSDQLRPSSSAAVQSLQRLGLQTVMLTGDNAATAQRIASHVGVTDIRADLLPDDKVSAIRALQQQGPTAMIGDGINDAPALATADVGIAMGIGGTDVALEAADVALMGDELAHVPVAIRLARQTMAIIRQNIVISLATKALFLGLTFAGVTNLWLAVLADVGMSLIVTFNSLRLVRTGGELRAPEAPSRSIGGHPQMVGD